MSENHYDFQCIACDEDYWLFEVLRKSDVEAVKRCGRSEFERIIIFVNSRITQSKNYNRYEFYNVKTSVCQIMTK